MRVPVLYGQTEKNEYAESAINVLVEKIHLGKPYLTDHTQTRYPTHCVDVARFLMQLVMKRFEVTIFSLDKTIIFLIQQHLQI